MSCFPLLSGLDTVSVFFHETLEVVLPFWSCLIGLCRGEVFELHLHVFHSHSYMYQLCHHHGFRSRKDCIGLCQYFQIVYLCPYYLHYCLSVFYHLMVLFWMEWWCTVYFLRCCGVTPFSCGCYRSFLLLVRLAKDFLLFSLYLEVGGLSSPLSDDVIENHCLRQNGYFFVNNNGVSDCLNYCSCWFSPLFQSFN